ncbi:MAG: hypothetical protein JWL59_919 [Chthoniobacteraceae bacterium]|nr:hypothetical protein [Chthoniobacteraceae bacterium]
MQKDSPNASTTLQANSVTEIEPVAITAFEERGFRWKSTVGDELTFERPLNKTDEVLYGTWGDEKSIERVVLRITPVKTGTFKAACFPYTIRNPNSGMEDISRRLSVHSQTYSGALHDMRRSLNR